MNKTKLVAALDQLILPNVTYFRPENPEIPKTVITPDDAINLISYIDKHGVQEEKKEQIIQAIFSSTPIVGEASETKEAILGKTCAPLINDCYQAMGFTESFQAPAPTPEITRGIPNEISNDRDLRALMNYIAMNTTQPLVERIDMAMKKLSEPYRPPLIFRWLPRFIIEPFLPKWNRQIARKKALEKMQQAYDIRTAIKNKKDDINNAIEGTLPKVIATHQEVVEPSTRQEKGWLRLRATESPEQQEYTHPGSTTTAHEKHTDTTKKGDSDLGPVSKGEPEKHPIKITPPPAQVETVDKEKKSDSYEQLVCFVLEGKTNKNTAEQLRDKIKSCVPGTDDTTLEAQDKIKTLCHDILTDDNRERIEKLNDIESCIACIAKHESDASIAREILRPLLSHLLIQATDEIFTGNLDETKVINGKDLTLAQFAMQLEDPGLIAHAKKKYHEGGDKKTHDQLLNFEPESMVNQATMGFTQLRKAPPMNIEINTSPLHSMARKNN